jgi:hypothetical protein
VLARKHGLQLYRCDDCFAEHQGRATADEHPRFHRLKGMDWDEIWMRPAEELGWCCLLVDGRCSIEENAALIETHFGLKEK